MAQSLIGGMTNSSHQSFQDILDDLEKFSTLTKETILFINSNKEEITDYWNSSVDYSFKMIVSYAQRFFNTAYVDFEEIKTDLQIEVAEHHYKRLDSVGNLAYELDIDIGDVWHKNYKNKEYGVSEFYKVENIYGEVRDLAVTLTDVSNLASRLKDFIGKTSLSSKINNKEKITNEIFVSQVRIDELKSIKKSSFDLCRLIKLCEEMNSALQSESFLTIAILTRAVIDHVPPIFNEKSFNQVANNYKSTKSFKDSMKNLNSSTRKIADAFLHTHIRRKETLPNLVQINCSQDLDVLPSF